MRHEHADLIIAWANGEEIQYSQSPDEWLDVSHPSWSEGAKYRVKPVPKEDVTLYYRGLYVASNLRLCGYLTEGVNSSLSLTFDGETGKLKDAKVLR